MLIPEAKTTKMVEEEGQLLIHLVQTGDGKRLQEALLKQQQQKKKKEVQCGEAKMELRAVEYADKNGYTPLHWAAHCDEALMAANLIHCGNAEPNARTKRGETFIHRAAARNALRLLRALRIRSQEEEEEEEEEELGGGTDKLSSTTTTTTPSPTSCIPINKDILEATNSWNERALHIAAAGGHKAVLEALVVLKADVNAVDKWGRTPLKAGKDMFGLTALHKFASWNKTDLIEAIAPHLTGPQFNQQTPKEKDTALHLAVKMGAARAVFMLVSSPKIDISIRNKKNETALEVAQGVYGRSNTCKDDDAPMSQIFLCLSSAFKQLNKKDDLT
eukprot:jgi/Bigna1/145432/aug1.99_g20140